MLMGMSEDEATQFLERISAATIVNQAVLKCMLAQMPVNIDTVILFIGDFIDPNEPNAAGLIRNIERSLTEMLETKPLRRAANQA